MFGLEKKKKKPFEFDLEKELKAEYDQRLQKFRETKEAEAAELGQQIRDLTAQLNAMQTSVTNEPEKEEKVETATESEPLPPATDGDTSNSDNTELNARITTLEEELASALTRHTEALKEVETYKAKVDELQTDLDGREDVEEELMHDKEDVRSSRLLVLFFVCFITAFS